MTELNLVHGHRNPEYTTMLPHRKFNQSVIGQSTMNSSSRQGSLRWGNQTEGALSAPNFSADYDRTIDNNITIWSDAVWQLADHTRRDLGRVIGGNIHMIEENFVGKESKSQGRSE